MKISTIASITGVLSGMKINKISDKRVKSALLNDYLHLRRHLKDADADREEVVKKFREDWRDELAAVVFFSVVMLTFLEKGGWWSVYVPTAYIIYCIVRDFRRLLKYKDKK